MTRRRGLWNVPIALALIAALVSGVADLHPASALAQVPVIEVTKTPSVGSVPESGGMVTFAVEVTNSSAASVTLTDLIDSEFGDLLDPANPAISDNDCDDQPTTIDVDGTLACSFAAMLTGDAGGPDHANTVTATVQDGGGNPASGDGAATVSFTDVMPTVSVSKTPSVGSVPEPGGMVVFAVEVTNTSLEPVTLSSLTDDVFGDLLDSLNPAVTANDCDDQPTSIDAGAALTCSFAAELSGLAGDPDHVNTVTATVQDDEANPAEGSDDATVVFGDDLPTISVTKTPSVGSVPEPGGTVTFTVEVTNTSVEPVTLTSLTDDVYGDLLDAGNPAITGNDCHEQPAAIDPGETLTCGFDAQVEGFADGDDHLDTVIAQAGDGEGNTATGADDATVTFTDVEPSISVTKTASVESMPEPGGTVTFTVEITNTGFEPVTVISFGDNVFGELLEGPNPEITNNDCSQQPTTIEVDGTLTCSFDGEVLGAFGDPDHVNTVVVTVEDGSGNRVQAFDDATVAFTEGEAEPASVAGTVWVDLDGTLTRTQPEPPLESVTIRLLDASGDPVATAVTSADGSYAFGDLVAGDYTIEIDQSTVPAGYELAADPDGDVSGAAAVTLAAGEHLAGQDFVEAGTGSIGDLVWLDDNADGVQDLDEEPLANITVGLTYAGPDGVLGSADDWVFGPRTTGTDGLYRFDNLPPGTYRVEVDMDTVGQGMSATTATDQSVTLAPGEDYDDGDVGFAPGDDILPQTGTDTERLGLAALTFLFAGMALLLIGRELGRRRHLRVGLERLLR